MTFSTRKTSQRKFSVLAAAAILAFSSSAMADVKESYLEYDGGPQWLGANDGLGNLSAGLTSNRPWSGNTSLPSSVGLSFKGVSQFDLRNLLGGSFIPPDTMGAVGATQFMEATNGVYAIYSKSTGALQSMVKADTFWTAAGATGGLNGDARVLFDAPSQKWVALQFGASVSDIQIAVSTTSSATGPWQSTKFTGFAGGAFGGIADFPTLAIDAAGVYIGTNNFTCTNAACASTFSGTTLNVISRADLFGAVPTAANVKQFVTPFTGVSPPDADRGFAIQGVNSTGATSGRIVAASLYSDNALRYNVVNPGTAGATLTGNSTLTLTPYQANNVKGSQPDGTLNIDTGDQRIAGNAWEQNGKIYFVYTAQSVGSNHTEVRYVVSNATTNAIIQQGAISDANYDFYQGSIAVNASGQVVIGYNRSGTSAVDGQVTLFARTYNSDAAGNLVQTDQLLLHVSPVNDYHNGSVQGAASVGRQRWGDYSAVTLDPNNAQSFWVIGQYAEVWNNVAGCTPGNPPGCTQTNGSSWGTWIADINVAALPIPEPQTYGMMMLGLLAVGGMVRRKAAAKA